MKNQLRKLFAFTFLLSALSGCKKADNFYTELNNLPQVDVGGNYAYKTSYLVGDTLVIYGKLNPQNNLKITIGDVNGQILSIDTVKTPPSNPLGSLDRVSVLITTEMIGKNQEVKISSGGNTILSASITVYNKGGNGSFNQPLKAVALSSLSNDNNQMLYCINGKGDIYYHNSTGIRHIKKIGADELIYQTSGSFIAGGVDPTGHYLYYSEYAGSGSTFNRLDLSSKTLTILNDSPGIGAPYEGGISNVHIKVTGIYPDSKGNVYLAVGGDNNHTDAAGKIIPYAMAIYNTSDGKVTYSIKDIIYSGYGDMPGNKANIVNTVNGIRVGAEDGVVYILQQSFKTGNPLVIDVLDLPAHSLLQEFTLTPNTSGTAAGYTELIAPFTSLQVAAVDDSGSANLFGLMPMPGKRLQTLFFQYVSGSIINMGSVNIAAQLGLPRWTVLDFTDQRTYAWAPGRFDPGNYSFNQFDVMLNYDEDNNLYMTGNGKTVIVKTVIQ